MNSLVITDFIASNGKQPASEATAIRVETIQLLNRCQHRFTDNIIGGIC